MTNEPAQDDVATARFLCVAGPDSGACVSLTPGRHVVGRALTADLRIDDPDLEPHALLVDVADTRRVAVGQLAGRTPATISGAPIDGMVPVSTGESVHLGATRLVLSGSTRADGWEWPFLGRRHGDGGDEALRIALGWGPLPPAGDDWMHQMPVPGDHVVNVDAGPGASIAFAGERLAIDAVLRSIVVQILGRALYRRARLVVACEEPHAWNWTRELGDAVSICSPDELHGLWSAEARPRRWVSGERAVILTDRPDRLPSGLEGSHGFGHGEPPPTILAVCAPGSAPPSLRSLVELGSRFRGRWIADRDAACAAVPVHLCGITAGTAAEAARSHRRGDDRTETSARAARMSLNRRSRPSGWLR